MNAKVEFCRAIRPRFFLLNLASELDYQNNDKLFAMSDVTESVGSEVIYAVSSISGKATMDCSNLLASLQKRILWSTLFQLEFLIISKR